MRVKPACGGSSREISPPWPPTLSCSGNRGWNVGTIRQHWTGSSEFDRFQQEQQAAAQERRSVRPTDRFRPVRLDHDQRLKLQQLLATHSELEAAWLAEKELQHQPHRRLFVLVVAAKRSGLWDRKCNERSASLARQLSTQLVLPGQWLVIPATGGFHKLARVIRNIPQSRLEWESATST